MDIITLWDITTRIMAQIIPIPEFRQQEEYWSLKQKEENHQSKETLKSKTGKFHQESS